MSSLSSTSVSQIPSGLNLNFTSSEENEFLAMETIVIIQSSVNHEHFDFISGRFGSLEAGLPCKVPLWFALQLRCNGKCVIDIPEWLDVENLKETIENQKSSEQFVSVLI